MADISAKLRQIAPGIRAATLAARCDFSFSSAKKYLDGGSPSVENAIAIAKSFNVSLDWLLTEEESQGQPLTQDEILLLEGFRRAGEEGKSALMAMVKAIKPAVKS